MKNACYNTSAASACRLPAGLLLLVVGAFATPARAEDPTVDQAIEGITSQDFGELRDSLRRLNESSLDDPKLAEAMVKGLRLNPKLRWLYRRFGLPVMERVAKAHPETLVTFLSAPVDYLEWQRYYERVFFKLGPIPLEQLDDLATLCGRGNEFAERALPHWQKMADEAMPLLAKRWNNNSARKEWAVGAMRLLGRSWRNADAETKATIREMFPVFHSHEDANVRRAVVMAFARNGRRLDADFFPLILASLKDSSESVRLGALQQCIWGLSSESQTRSRPSSHFAWILSKLLAGARLQQQRTQLAAAVLACAQSSGPCVQARAMNVIEACRLPVSNELVPFINSADDEVGNAAVKAVRRWSPEIGDALLAACMSQSGYRSQLAKDKLGHLLARSSKTQLDMIGQHLQACEANKRAAALHVLREVRQDETSVSNRDSLQATIYRLIDSGEDR
jgi:hypothetical protein